MLPKDNELRSTTYEVKQLVCPLGLEVQEIHACPNDCILYRGDYENLDACPYTVHCVTRSEKMILGTSRGSVPGREFPPRSCGTRL